MYKRNFLDYIFLFLKGLAMGAANKVPGVSGGMVALVTGFYEELIYSFQKFNKKALQLLLKGRFRSFFQYVNFKFLLIVNLGSLSAYFSVSLVLDYFIKNYEIYVWSLFFGLIMGSIYYIKKSLTNINLNTYILIAIGTSLGLLLTFIDPLPQLCIMVCFFMWHN